MMKYLQISLFITIVVVAEICCGDKRIGPCPGIPLDSCECFQRLLDDNIDISNMTDIVSRNWAISLWYQDISHSFQKLLHTAPDSTPGLPSVGIWPTIGAWASNAVGFSIRQQPVPELWSYIIQDLPHFMQEILSKIPFTLMNTLFKDILKHTSVALGAGNVFVFREIAVAYAHYGFTFCADKTRPSDAKMNDFVKNYVCSDGQCDLANAMWALFEAHYAPESMTFSERDQLLLVQGMYAGLAEQTHLQPFINASLPGYTTNWCRLWPSKNTTQCQDFLNTVVTKMMVHLLIGKHRLLSDHDIPKGIHNGSNFSPFLSTLSLPQAHDLMLKMLNSTTLGLDHTAANDWNSLAQRMRFVSPLFWVFLDHEDVNCYLFSAEQELLIRTNRSQSMDPHSWLKICDKDCCADNGRWNGENS
ncbi:unnamed protein product [Adineta ricciae]|uniref:Uncharacterized protein n=1 Tax=Adineta ricciae TaxID=249248 RepID=A0A815DNV9_ADIRI|nr:unnamed protein product [Adineta ricciae]CAF1422142.1 unnamed protein product [Adineta ricciae]